MHWVKSVCIRRFSGLHFLVLGLNIQFRCGKLGIEKLRMRTFFTQCQSMKNVPSLILHLGENAVIARWQILNFSLLQSINRFFITEPCFNSLIVIFVSWFFCRASSSCWWFQMFAKKEKDWGGTPLCPQQLPELKQSLTSKHFLPYRYIMFVSSISLPPQIKMMDKSWVLKTCFCYFWQSFFLVKKGDKCFIALLSVKFLTRFSMVY